MTSTLTSKGQTTIPKDIRERLGLKPGDKIDFVVDDDGRVYLVAATKDIMALKGLLARPGQPRLTVEEMNESIRKRFSRA